MAGIQLAILLAALDQTIVNPALTAISTDLHSVDRLSWITVGYLLTSTSLSPIYGKLSDLHGRGRMILIAITIFVGASVLCGLAQTVLQLAAARALQGLGGGGLLVLAQAIIADFVSPRDRGKYQAFTASTWAFAGIAGPTLGGLFADYLSWRWIFWINIPLGILAFVLCRRAASRLTRPVRRKAPIDLLGALLLTAGVTFLLSAVGQSNHGWSASGFAEAALGGALLACFIAQERRAREPILPPRLYTNRIIAQTNVLGFALAAVQFAALVLLPVFFQLILGVSATTSGLMIIPMLVGIPIASVVAGQVMARSGRYRMIIPVAFVLTSAGYALFAFVVDHHNVQAIEGATLLLGLGIGCCGPVLMTATQNAAESGDIGAATSSMTFARSLGASLGTALFWALLLVPLTSQAPGAAGVLFHTGQAGVAALALLALGFRHAFVVAALVALGTAAFALTLKEKVLGTAPRTLLAASSARS